MHVAVRGLEGEVGSLSRFAGLELWSSGFLASAFYTFSHLSGLCVWLLGTCSFGFRRDNPQGSERTRGDQLLTLPAHRSGAAGTLPYNPLPCIFLGLAQSSPCWLLGTCIPDLCSTSHED